MAKLKEISENFSQYIVAPIAQFGLAGFRFDIEGSTETSLTADITDHYVEDNSTLQDHIAIRPERLVLNSVVGEQVFVDGLEIVSDAQELLRKLIVLDAYLPELTRGAEQARELAQTDFLDLSADSLDSLQNLWELTRNLNPGATRQQQSYLYFKALFQQRIPIAVQTPYGYMVNMAIEGVTATQGEETIYISSFTLTLKKIRTASLQLVAFDPSKYQSRGAEQRAPQTNNGSTNGENVSTLFILGKSVFGTPEEAATQ